MARRRAVITGCGVVSPLGIGLVPTWTAMCRGLSAIAVEPAAADSAPLVCARVPSFSPQEFVHDPRPLRLMDRSTTFGAVALALAARDAAVDISRLPPGRSGAFFGVPGRSYDYEEMRRAVVASCPDGTFDPTSFGAIGFDQVSPMWLLKGLSNGLLFFASTTYQLTGANGNFDLGGISATVALGEAATAIRRGEVDVAFAGGYDSWLLADRVDPLQASGLLARPSGDGAAANRCYDRRRDGFAVSEGSAMFVVEEAARAGERGVVPYGEIAGWATATCPSSRHTLGVSADGFAAALGQALEIAHAGRVDLVYGHGLATQHADRAESAGLAAALGRTSSTVPVTAPKSAIGNSGAASGAIEAAAALMSLRDERVPPTIGFAERDPDCDVAVVSGRTRAIRAERIAMLNANLAGAHVALILERVAP